MRTHDRRWIAFDAAGTLFDAAEPVENTYAGCFSTLGFGLPESTWKTAFIRALEITPDPIYAASGDWDAAENQWWSDLVGNAAISTGDSLTADGGAAESAAIPFFHIDRPHTDLTAFAEWHEARFFRK